MSQAPSNTCAGATLLTVNGPCGTGTITDGTIDPPATASCGTVKKEGWFRFVAANTTATVTCISGNRQLLVQVFSGACGSLTEIGCANVNTTNGPQTEFVNLVGLTIGFTYYIRVANEGNQNMNLTSCCVTGPPPAPVNDDPCGAVVLNVNTGSCSYQSADLESSATLTAGIPAPGCGSLGPDIWFKAVVPASGRIIIDLAPSGGPTDMCMAWYTGTNCSNITTLVECDDDDSHQRKRLGLVGQAHQTINR